MFNRFCFFILTTCLHQTLFSQNSVTLHGAASGETINKNIYGHFAEHLGHCIYGGFYVGDSSQSIPNIRGIRQDIVDALKKLKVPVLRWPGGCFADTYHWKDGIGPKNKRPAMVNAWWGGVTEDNSFGSHEFMDLCEQIGAAPYISGNVGSGTVQELAEWVEYMNSNSQNPMSDLRRQNGHEEPWNVKYWGVANEAWGCGGNMRAEYYADVYRRYATFMTSGGDSPLFRIASGASDADYHWTEVMMRDIPHYLLQGIGLHHYSVINWNKKSSATNFSEAEYFATMQQALLMDELIQKHSAIMDKYDPEKKVALVVDEWGGWYDTEPGTNPAFLYQQNTMRDAMIAGVTLNIFNNHCDRVRMANLAQTVNVLQAVILTNGAKMILTPTYHVMEMYNVHQDATMIPVTVNSSDYVLGNQSLPAISVSASKDKNGIIHISLVNIDAVKAQAVTVKLDDVKTSSVTGRILTAAKLQDHNTFEQPEKIKPVIFNGTKLAGGLLQVTLPPFSVVVLALK
ncbi:MAG TPA: alpha-N-arabinofuranosidase [Chitinophagaceae bacterium]|nr:alpha-N-arabinofuranosidase [Chitinophagaceae bacterium]